MSLRIPLDSVVVLPRRKRVTLDDVWSEVAAEQIASLLATDGSLRVIPPECVHADAFDDEERNAEEIGRAFHVGAAVVCGARYEPPSLDVDLELIDVLGESTVAQQTFLSSAPGAGRLCLEAARALSAWMTDGDRLRHDARPRQLETLVAIRSAVRDRRLDEALRACRDVRLDALDPELQIEIARVVVSGPSSLLSNADVALAKRALQRLSTAEADELRARIAVRFDRRWKTAAARFEAACARSDSSRVRASYALFLIAMGRFDDARSHLRWVTIDARRTQLARLIDALLAGDREEAARGIRSAVPVGDDDPYVQAQQHPTFEAARRAIEIRSPLAMFAGVDPSFDELRRDPTFRRLLR